LPSTAIQSIVTRSYGDLSPQMRRAAQFLLDHTDEVATRSLRHVAGSAQLPPPTFSRLARALGCNTYEELRDLCRDEIRQRKSRFADKALKLLDMDANAAVSGREPYLVRQSASAISNIQTLLESTENRQLEQTAARLAAAGNVVLIGTLSSYAFVDYVSYLAGMAFPNWSVIGRGGASMCSGISGLGKHDAALVVSKEPFARRSILAARLAHEQGAYVVAITDAGHSPVWEFADSVFMVSTESPQFFTSHVAALVLLETLMGMVVKSRGADAQRRIAEVERQNHRLGEYWED